MNGTTTVNVRLFAFGENGQTLRQVDIPLEQAASTEEGTLALAWHFGQNDFQSKNIRSASAGDVIELPSGRHLVMAIGFKKLSQEQYDDYVKSDDNRRRGMTYGI